MIYSLSITSMQRSRTRTLRNPRVPEFPVNNNVGGFRNSGTKYGLPPNAYTDCKNIVISEDGGFKRRRTADQLWVEPDSTNGRIHGIFYHEGFWFIRVKGTNIQTLLTPWDTWTTRQTGYSVSWKDKTTFLSFQATSTAGSITKTLSEESDDRFLRVSWTMIPNDHVGKIIKIWSEYKLINGNTDTVIYIQEKLQGSYSNGTSIQIYEQVEAVYIFSPGQNVRIWRGGANFETLPFSYDTAELQSSWWATNTGRLMAIKNDKKVWISELGTWEFFQKDSFIPAELGGDMTAIKAINKSMVVYSTSWRGRILWDNLDNYRIDISETNKGCIAPGSVANWVNVQYYLSKEGIEYLNAIENSTVMEGISLSDIMSKTFERHDDFSWAQAAVSNGKMYLSIQDWVYIYDLEKSVKNHKPIFTLAQYEECSQVWVSDALPGEWTCAEELAWILYFGQWGKCYYITDEKIWPEETQKALEYMIEFPIQHYGSKRLMKKIQKYSTYFQHNIDLTWARTRFRIFLSKDEWDYSMIRDVENLYNIECNINERVYSTSIKIEVKDMESIVDTQIEFMYSIMEAFVFNKK